MMDSDDGVDLMKNDFGSESAAGDFGSAAGIGTINDDERALTDVITPCYASMGTRTPGTVGREHAIAKK